MDAIQESINNIYTTDPPCDQSCKDFIDATNINAIVSTIQQALDDNTIISGIIAAIDNIIIDNSTQNEIKELVDLTNNADALLRNFSDAFVEDYTQVIRDDVDTVKSDIKQQVTDLTKELQDIDLNNVDAIQNISKTLDDISDLSDYILYGTLGPAVILGIALLLSCIGLIIGKTHFNVAH